MALGLPISATYGSESGFFSVVALLMGTFGRDALAAHTVVYQIIYIVFMVTVGLSHAVSIIVSRRLAMDQLAEAARISRTTLGIGFTIMTLVALPYLVAPHIVLRPFLDPNESQGALTLAIHLLIIAALMQWFDCWQNIGVGLLRGLDDTVGSFRMTLIGYWIVGLPAAWLIGYGVNLGPVGVWLGLTTGLIATSGLMLRRFHKGLTQRGTYQVDYVQSSRSAG
jgi:multidrug resistance protein, MATE family